MDQRLMLLVAVTIAISDNARGGSARNWAYIEKANKVPDIPRDALTCYGCSYTAYTSSNATFAKEMNAHAEKHWNNKLCVGTATSTEGFDAARKAGNMSSCEAEVKCGRGHLKLKQNLFGQIVENDWWLSSCISKDEDDGRPLGCTENMDLINFNGGLTEIYMVEGTGIYCTCGTDYCNHGTTITVAMTAFVSGLVAVFTPY